MSSSCLLLSPSSKFLDADCLQRKVSGVLGPGPTHAPSGAPTPTSSPWLIKLEPAHSWPALSTWFSYACNIGVASLSRLDSTLTLPHLYFACVPALLHTISLPSTTLHLRIVRLFLSSSLCYSLFPSFCVPLLSQEGIGIGKGRSIRLFRKVGESRGRHCLSTTCLQLLESCRSGQQRRLSSTSYRKRFIVEQVLFIPLRALSNYRTRVCTTSQVDH